MEIGFTKTVFITYNFQMEWHHQEIAKDEHEDLHKTGSIFHLLYIMAVDGNKIMSKNISIDQQVCHTKKNYNICINVNVNVDENEPCKLQRA